MSKNAAGQKAKTGQMDVLKSAITELDATLAGPVDGLELTLKQAREDLKRNEEDQEDISFSRTESIPRTWWNHHRKIPYHKSTLW